MANSRYGALELPNFRLLLIGRVLVTLALQIQGMAVGWQIYALTRDPLILGLIGLSEAFPAIGVALFAGHVADIMDRRRILMAVVAILSVCVAILAVCTKVLDPHYVVASLFIIVAVTGFARGFYGPAAFGIVSDIVPRELYGNSSAWNTASWQLSAVAGPVLGGFLYVSFGPTITYATSATLLGAALLCFLVINSVTTLSTLRTTSVRENMLDGLRFVFSNQVILAAMSLDLFAVLFGGAVALLPIFTSEVFRMGPEALGIMRAAPSVGSFVTAAFLTQRPIVKNAGAILLVAVAGFGLCMIGFGLSTSFYFSLFLLALSGALDGVSIYVRSTIIQLTTPNDMKGRVAAVNSIFIGSSNEIGEFESGITAKLMGLVPSVVFGGCMTLIVVLTTFFKAPKLRNLHMGSIENQNA
jgi:MFS family permease